VTDTKRGSIDLRTHLEALTRFWRSVLAVTLLGLGLAALLTVLATPTYQSKTTFFVATSGPAAGASNTPLQADEFAQRRINSYVGVIKSERLAQVILDATGLPLTTTELSDTISAAADPDTVLLTVTVTDISRDRSLLIARSVADNLDTTIGKLDNRGSQSNVQIRVISGPTLLPDPVTPRVKLYLAIGLLLGLGLGVAQALVRQQLDSSFRSREQLAETTGLPTLGWLQYDKTAKAAPILTPDGGHSRRSETFRQLRTNLRFVNATSPIEVLVVTSSVDDEGKSSTAANLAVSFAQAGRRTLLIDGDLRAPKLQRYLDLEGAAGLTSVLIGEAALADVVQEWGHGVLHVLTSGPIPPNPSELLGSAAMEKLVRDARLSYDLVVIDTPPLLPVTDAAVTAVEADGVLLIVRYGSTHVDQVLRSVSALESVDARILGTVVTMARDTHRDRLPAYAE
jgi:capsular exopolysaccharide synthesis family protein